jgi:hypothetical protein
MILRSSFSAGLSSRLSSCPSGPPHLDAGEDQEGAEHIEDPVELVQQPGTHQDHDGAQHDGAQDADHQHPLLERRRHREVGEDQQEDEDVVDRQALLDQVAGQELQRLLVGDLGRAGGVLDGPPQQPLNRKLTATQASDQYRASLTPTSWAPCFLSTTKSTNRATSTKATKTPQSQRGAMVSMMTDLF